VTSPAERERLAAVFAHPGVAQAYQYRPPQEAETFDILERVVADRPADVLDIGAGEGALARPLAASVDHVDALDVSAAMVEAGRFHRTASLAREWMTAEECAAFDQAVASIVAPYAADGLLDLEVVADLAWGRIVAS
jgi:2-polyprenyl-3-methyl-5-hydroxy-6-metoxy-1,4-benzoquinol methylase